MTDLKNRRDKIVIGTRRSPLALFQANFIKDEIERAHPGTSVELLKIQTTGDKITDVPLAKVGGKGLFVKEIEEALLDGRVDLAVHSMKDVPVALPEGLHLSVIPKREDPRDVFIGRRVKRLQDLPQGSVVGTSSLRREAQLKHYRRDLKIQALRGNLDTRLRKLASGPFDAIILAAAGVRRLGLSSQISEYLDPTLSLPAIGQGALGLECRIDDKHINGLLAPLNDPDTWDCVGSERAFNHRLEGGCQVPLAAHAHLDGAELILEGLVASVDGERVIREQTKGARHEGEAMGIELANRLLSRGADKILREIYKE